VTTGDELRPVTALFADIVGSTSLGERLTGGEIKALMGECVSRMSRAAEEFGGTIQVAHACRAGPLLSPGPDLQIRFRKSIF
jgi:class 3 adenylate cyclase